jgi:hypothetical protein
MLHLLPAHHEISKHNFPNETKVKTKQNKTIPNLNSNLTKSMTHHNQTKELTTWFLSGRRKFEVVGKKVETPPPPPPPPPSSTYLPPSGKAGTGRLSPVAEKLLDLVAFGNNLRVETRNRGNGERMLSIPPRPPEVDASHSVPATPNFCSNHCLGSTLSPPITLSRFLLTQFTSTFLSLIFLSSMVITLKSGQTNVRSILIPSLCLHLYVLGMCLHLYVLGMLR